MKKFKFNLEAVLNFKEKIEEHEKGVLTFMNGRLAEFNRQLAALKNRYAEEISSFEEQSAKGFTVSEAARGKAIIKGLEISIESKIEEIENQIKLIEQQTEVVVTATRERKSIQKLKEKKLEKYDKDVLKENELFIEEFASIQAITAKNT